MYDVVILHGTFGDPFENWIPWLFKKLTDQGKKVLVPQFPTPVGQNYHNWEKILLCYKASISPKTIFVGHSLGATFAVDFVVKNQIKIDKLILLAGFYQAAGNLEIDILNQSFFEYQSIVVDLKNYTNQTLAIYGDNDPHLSLEILASFADLISASTQIIPNGGHLNQGAGFIKCPFLLDLILK